MNTNYRTDTGILLAAVFLSLFLVSCSEQKYSNLVATLAFKTSAPGFISTDDLADETLKVNTLEIFPANFVITRLTETVQLHVNAIMGNGSTLKDTSLVNWSGSDSSIVTVDSAGLVTAVAAGSARITATLGDKTQVITITVDESLRTINGQVRYEDKLYDKNGLVLFSLTPELKAARYVSIDLLDMNNRILQTRSSSATGIFEFGNVLYDQYRIRVLAQVDNPVAAGFNVKTMDKALYSVVRESVAGTNTYEIQIRDSSSSSSSDNPAGAFNILDVMTSAAEFSQQVLTIPVRDLTIFWEPDNGFGTYYCNAFDKKSCINGEGIYVLSQHQFSFTAREADYDEYDDDVLMHEYGHYIVENFATDNSPGGCHNLTDNNLDLRLAWSEGLGTFFPIAIKDWLRINNPALLSMRDTEPVTLYVDTLEKKVFGATNTVSEAIISFDIANFKDADPVTSPDQAEVYFYASSEVAILKILWGLTQEFGMSRVWDVVANYFKQANTTTNLATFWDGFLTNEQFKASELTRLESILNERQVYYQDDVNESNDTFNSATQTNPQATEFEDNTIYKKTGSAADVDLFALDAEAGKSYEVKTQELRNGIDTRIRIVDLQGNLVVLNGRPMENDDADPDSYERYDAGCFGGSARIFVDKTSLASRLVFSPATTGSYFVEVSRQNKFSKEDDFTGHYGSYQLSITTQ